jgi:DNA-binding XRE family transcriptional regulator
MHLFSILGRACMAISASEHTFFVQLAARIATLRKELDITQVQMSELLKVSQQTINACEVGRRRMPKAQQRFVMQMIDTVLAQQGR